MPSLAYSFAFLRELFNYALCMLKQYLKISGVCNGSNLLQVAPITNSAYFIDCIFIQQIIFDLEWVVFSVR